jgi:hypothetical protein
MREYNERGDAIDLLQLTSRQTEGIGTGPDVSSAGLEVAATAWSMSSDKHGSRRLPGAEALAALTTYRRGTGGSCWFSAAGRACGFA